MENLFEIRYIRDKAIVKQLYNYINFFRPVAMILNILLVLLSIVYIVWFLMFNKTVYLCCFLFAIVIIATKLITHFKSIDLILKRDLELNGGEPLEIIITVNEEGLCQHTKNGVAALMNYSQIKSIKKHGDFIMITSKASLLYILPANSFTVGDAEGLYSFITSKIKDAKKS